MALPPTLDAASGLSSSLPARPWDDSEIEKVSLLNGVPPIAAGSHTHTAMNSLMAAPAVLQFGQMLEQPPDQPINFGSNKAAGESSIKRPDDLQPVPASFDHWPAAPLKIACPQCGIYTTTTLEQETECVGFTSLCSDGPLFRDTVSHYCPRCNGRLGIHYTGQSCGRGMGCCHVQ